MNEDWEWEDLLPEDKKKELAETAPRKTASAKKKSASGSRRTGTASKGGSTGAKKSGSGTKKSGAGASKETAARSKSVSSSAGKSRSAQSADSTGQKSKRPVSRSSVRKKKKRRKKKKSKAFWLGYGIFVLLLFLAAFIILYSVRRRMIEYRDNTPETLIREQLANLSDADIATMFVSNPQYETPAEAAANIRAYLAEGTLSIRRADQDDRNDEKAYSVHKDGRKLFTVYLKSQKSVNMFGLLNYDILSFSGYEAAGDVELFRYEITAPSVYTVQVNGVTVTDPVKSEPFSGFADGAQFASVPTMNTYEIGHLTKEASIRVSENGADIPVQVSETIDLTETYRASHTFSTMEDAGIDFDAIAFAKQWSLFLRDDIGGNLHGFYTLEPYLITGTGMEQKAREWGSSIDITFTSMHTLNNPPFTNERIESVVRFDEDTACVDVYLEMHMTLTRTGENRTDVFNSTIYLVRIGDGTWKVVNIRGADESDE